YASAFTESDVSIALNAAFNLGLNKKYHRPKDLNKKLKKILK
ncbi:MAG TPA: transposase, partial [Lachnospiraceae bacterium]|nr:transposase [Lachnospiraceae bacterium]HBZ89501.1 transposase [Lachnospiraceae bacterium]